MDFKVKRTVFIIILLLISEISETQQKKILCLLGAETENAQTWNKILLNELSAKGHELTIFTPTIWELESNSNTELVHLENTEVFFQTSNTRNKTSSRVWKLIINWYNQQAASCRRNLESIGLWDSLHQILNKTSYFDLIIYDVKYLPGCLLPMAHLFGDIPIVGITSTTLTLEVLSINDNSVLKAAVDPHTLSGFERNMNFWTRFYNMILYVLDLCYRKWILQPLLESMWDHYTEANDIYTPNSVHELMPRFKVILANYHPVLHTVKNLPINVVPVPGLHIKKNPVFAVSPDLYKFMKNSENGMVLIDLDIKQLDETHILTVFEAIRKFPNYGFIWKVDKTTDMPKNNLNNLCAEEKLEIQGFFGRPFVVKKIKFLLTIPEILRIQECFFYGIPMITVVLEPEQYYLAKRIEEHGVAINLELSNLTALSSSIEYILTNYSFRNTAMELQKSFRNQQNHPLDSAMWWVENLLKNPQAFDHLHTKNSLEFFAGSSLDILWLCQVVTLIFIFIVIVVFRRIVHHFRKVSKAKAQRELKKLKKEKRKIIKNIKNSTQLPKPK